MGLNHDQVMTLMKEFEADKVNEFNELILYAPENLYVLLDNCETVEEVEADVVRVLSRPIGKGDRHTSNILLSKVNNYFKAWLSKEDMELIYTELGYVEKREEMVKFIEEGFPIHTLESR